MMRRMRIRIVHETTYRYDTPADGVIQMLRLTPRNHDGQYVRRLAHRRLGRLPARRSTRTRSATSPMPSPPTARSTSSRVAGRGRGRDPGHRRASCAARSSAFRRASSCARPPLTAARRRDRATLRRECAPRRRSDDALELLHALLDAAARRHRPSTPTRPMPRTTAAEAFALKRGVCQDLTHIFIAARAQLGIPARYVGGYFHRDDGVIDQDAGHAWAEAFVPGSRLGRLRSGQRHLRRPTPMSASRSGSIISAPRRCAAPATAAAARRSSVNVHGRPGARGRSQN